MSLHLILVIAALVCFALAAAGVQSRVGLTPLGLLFVTPLMFVL